MKKLFSGLLLTFIAAVVSILAFIGSSTIVFTILHPEYIKEMVETPMFERNDTTFIEEFSPEEIRFDSLTGEINKE